mgnify:CR=1 FL=1
MAEERRTASGNWISRIAGVHNLRQTLSAHDAEPVLPLYKSRTADSFITSSLIAFLVLYAFISGYFLGVFQQYVLLQFLGPCLALTVLALWAMPDQTGVSHHNIERLFFAFIVINVLWPAYLAVSIPGLPWITLSKLILLASILGFGIVMATDRAARTDIASIFGRAKFVRFALIMFIATQFLTLPFSNNIADSLASAVNSQFYWTGILLIAMMVTIKPGRVERLAISLLLAAAALSLIALWEYRIQRLPWLDHLPSFVRVADPVVAKMLSGIRRTADGLYRVQTTYTTPLSCAEFMALVVPFVMHYFLATRRFIVRVAMVLLYLGIIFTIFVSRSRLGMIGLGLAHLAYPLLLGIRRRSTVRNDLVGPSLIALYPAMLLAFMGALLASRRLYVMFLGGGQHQASNDARESMYREGIPLILTHPWGHGMNQGAGVLGFFSPSGELTIDSYYLSIGLDFGVLGFIGFYGMLVAAIYFAVRVYFTSRDSEARIAAPVAIALGNYLVIKSVLSQSQNQFLMFALVGVALALNYRFYKAAQPARADMAAAAAA